MAYNSQTKSFTSEDWVQGQIITEDKLDELDKKALYGGNSILIQSTKPTGELAESNKIWINNEPEALMSAEVVTSDDLENIIAPLYDSTSAYAVGDYVITNDNNEIKLWRCKVAINGENWEANHWTQVEVGAGLKNFVTVSNTEPTNSLNKIWIKPEDNIEYQIPTYEEFTNLQNTFYEANMLTNTESARKFTWESGAISSSTGNPSSSTTRIRFGDYPVTTGYITRIVADEGYKFMVFFYTSTAHSSYVGVYDGNNIEKTGVWVKDIILGGKWYTDESGEEPSKKLYYFKVVAAKEDNTSISLTSSSHIHFYKAVDTTLTEQYTPAEAKAVGDTINAINKKIPSILRVMQYNIGDYVWGFTPYDATSAPSGKTLTVEQYNEKLINYQNAFTKYHPNILCLQEYNQNFNVNNNNSIITYNAREVLFDDIFSSRSISTTSTLTSALFSNETSVSFETVRLNGLTSSDGVTWKLGIYNVNNKEIVVCTGYLTPNNMPLREAELAYLFELIEERGYENVIISADFNCSLAEYSGPSSDVIALHPRLNGVTNNATTNYDALIAIIRSYGYLECNSNNWGWKQQASYVDHENTEPGSLENINNMKPLDNILIKGELAFLNAKVYKELYNNLSSDHLPLIADILLL